MLPGDQEWLAEYLAARLERQRIQDEMTREMLQHSRDALAKAREALALPVPIVWHPEQPKE